MGERRVRRGDVGRGKVAVVVQDGHAFGVLVVEPLGGFAVQQEILVQERFHLVSAFRVAFYPADRPPTIDQ